MVLATSIGIQKVFFESRYDVSGHAAEHLTSATAPFVAAAIVAILVWTTSVVRRQPEVVVACLAWLAAAVLVLIGNVRVVDDLIEAGLAHAPTEGLPDVADHGLADLAPWLGVAAAVLMAITLWRRGLVSSPVAIGSMVLSVVFPPWIIPGAGVVVLVFARAVAYGRSGTGPAQGRSETERI